MKTKILSLCIASLCMVGCTVSMPRTVGYYHEYLHIQGTIPVTKFNNDSTFFTDFGERGKWEVKKDTLRLYFKQKILKEKTENGEYDIEIVTIDKELPYLIKKNGKLLQAVLPPKILEDKSRPRHLGQLIWKDSETIREYLLEKINRRDTTGKKWTYEELFGPRPEKKKK